MDHILLLSHISNLSEHSSCGLHMNCITFEALFSFLIFLWPTDRPTVIFVTWNKILILLIFFYFPTDRLNKNSLPQIRHSKDQPTMALSCIFSLRSRISVTNRLSFKKFECSFLDQVAIDFKSVLTWSLPWQSWNWKYEKQDTQFSK